MSGQSDDIHVLITDVESRKGFDIVNIMQRHYGFSCVLCSSRDRRGALRVIYGQRVYRLRSSSYDQFEHDLDVIFTSQRDRVLVYLAVSEKPTLLLYRYLAERKPDQLRYLLPSEANFRLSGNKHEFQIFCEEQGFPVPRSYSRSDLPELTERFRPLVLKPRVGEGSVGLRYITEPDELTALRDIHWPAYLLQERINGNRQVAGAFFLCVKGKVVNAYTHQRLRTFPPAGGVTVFSQSTYMTEIVECGARVLAALDWEGVAMIEFLYDDEQQAWRIIELNPRLWGSVMLCAFNQSDMLRQYVAASLGESRELPRQPRNVYIRWYFPFEVLNWLKGKISLKDLLTLDTSKTCYVNFTYSSVYRSVAYLLYFTFNPRSIKRFFKKFAS